MACLLLKTSCDCIARITLFSVFMYVQNEGQFSTRMTLIAYYSVFVLLMIFNCWINKNKNFWSAKNLLGMFPYLKQCDVNLLISTENVYRDCSQLIEFHPLLQQLQLRCCPKTKERWIKSLIFVDSAKKPFIQDPKEVLDTSRHSSNSPCTSWCSSCSTLGKY